MELLLEVALIGLLSATLFHALRLERALGVLKQDRAALEALVDGFNQSTRLAEQGTERLRATADGAGRQLARQADMATGLRDDLTYLVERGERLADRLDASVRAARAMTQDTGSVGLRSTPFALPPPESEPEVAAPRVRSQAERDLLTALRMAR